MTNLEAVNGYLKNKRDEAIDYIQSASTLDDLNAKRTEKALSGAQVTMPFLDMDERESNSINEVPPADSQPVNLGVPVGKRYEGIEVEIPVEGDFELFTKYFENRYVCEGFMLTARGIYIKQYDFYNSGVSALKEQVRNGVNVVNQYLEELGSTIEFHHARLTDSVNKAVKDRMLEIVDKMEKDKNSDPWG